MQYVQSIIFLVRHHPGTLFLRDAWIYNMSPKLSGFLLCHVSNQTSSLPWNFKTPKLSHVIALAFIFVNKDGNLDDVIKWKHFPRYWPFVRGIHRSPVNSPHKGQWRGALMFTLICVWINGRVNNREAGDLRRYCAHYDVTVMETHQF